jgi:hypothetical protein
MYYVSWNLILHTFSDLGHYVYSRRVKINSAPMFLLFTSVIEFSLHCNLKNLFRIVYIFVPQLNPRIWITSHGTPVHPQSHTSFSSWGILGLPSMFTWCVGLARGGWGVGGGGAPRREWWRVSGKEVVLNLHPDFPLTQRFPLSLAMLKPYSYLR